MKNKNTTFRDENEFERRALQRSINKMTKTASLKELRMTHGFLLGIRR